MKNKILIPLLIALFAFVVLPIAALAGPTLPQTYFFNVIQDPNETPYPANVVSAVESNLFVVVDKMNGSALFSFHNTADPNAFVATSLYFMDIPPVLDAATGTIVTETGVDYERDTGGSAPGNLPGGNNVGFVPTDNYDPEPDPPTNGLGPGDLLEITFELDPDYGIGELTSVIDDGLLDIGFHVQAFQIPGFVGQSLSVHLNGNGGGGPGPGPTPIPEPATMLLLGTGLIGIAGTVRRRKKMQK